jgi:hypothetical protein
MLRKLLVISIFVSFFSITAKAQAPGGVPAQAWYRADLPNTLFSDAGTTPAASDATVYQWNEANGAPYNLVQTSASARPVYSNTVLANFNPTVTFDGSNDWMQFTAPAAVNIIDRTNGTLYAAGYVNKQKASGFAGFHPSMDYPGLHVFSSPYRMLFYTGGPGFQGLSVDTMKANMYFAAGTGWQNEAGTTTSYAAATVSVNGTRIDYNGNQLYNANLSTNARDLRIGADNNWGAFSGQLNEVMVFEDRLTPDQMDRVETYLAIKYGFTYAKGLQDYKNAASEIVWNATLNNGYHYNIAGIARDDQGALYQKQSWSTNSGYQVLIGVGTLANTNADNSGTLTDGQYLVWGDNGLDKVPNVATSDFAGLSHHFAAIWKVQNTGSVGTVRVAWPKSFSNLALIQSADAVIDADDVVTDMSANEITINGQVYNYADVTLDDGSYFTLAAKLSAPGGVTTGLLMWHKANDGTVGTGAKNIWRDISGNGRDVTQNNNINNQPQLITDASYTANNKKYSFNFNPFYYFDGSNDFFYRMGNDYFPVNNSPGSAYGVMFNSSVGGWRTAYGWGDDDPNLVRGDNNYYFTRDNGTVVNTGSAAAMKTRPAHIGGLAWRGNTSGVYLNLDGQIYSANYSIGTINSAGNFVIGAEGYGVTGNATEQFQGGIAEVFAYSVDHQNSAGDEKQRINSYLAIKYGITLKNDAGTATASYLSSASEVVWDVAANAGYNNNIAGIARDDNSALHQKQSQSNQTGQQVLIGTTGLANTNEQNSVGLEESQFLLWGDNGLAKVPAVSISDVPDINFRFAAVWKVQNTGSVGTVRVTWPAGLTNITLLQSSDPGFETVEAYTSMTANTITVNGVVYNYADVTLDDGTYFTFGARLNGPGGVAPDLRVWLRSDAGFTNAEWTDFSGNDNHYTQTNESRQPFMADKMFNFNPVVDFGTTGADARFMVLPVGKPYTANGSNSTLFTASLSKSKSGYTDIIGFGGTTTGSGLINANEPVFTKMDNNVLLYPYTTNPGFAPTQAHTLYLDDVSFTVGTAGIKYGKNGELRTANATVAAGNADFADGSVLGAQIEPRNGYIGEVIAYQRDLDEAEKKRVRSYVAIKYGITLLHDYVAADNSIFWDTTFNTGYNNNIAGIARDDDGSLYQKQSNSINPGNQVLISTTGLANSNAANTGSLADRQFLVWGDNGMAKSPTIPITGIPDVNHRFAAVWKVQNTNSIGTVRVAWKNVYAHLKLIQSDDETFDISDVVTDMSGVQTVDGVEYAYADVTLADGQYFTFAAFIQAPGGVTEGLLMWHKANDNLGAAGARDIWNDVSGNEKHVYQPNNTAYQPVLITDATHVADNRNYFFNYNPFYYFDGTNDFFYNEGINYFPATNSPGSVYGVMQNSGLGGYRSPITWGDDDPSLQKGDNFYHFFRDNGAYVSQNLNLNSVPAHIGALHWRGASNGLYLDFNGRIYANELANIGALQSPASNLNFAIGSEGYDLDGDGNEQYQGGIAEVFAYSVDHRNSTGDEMARINSYLALKYGITLNNADGTASIDYLNSQSQIIYAADATFRYNIAGIGHDFISALHQKQSRSVNTNTNGQVTIGLGEIAASNALNDHALADGQFLVWADNGVTTPMSETAGSYTALDYAGHNFSRRMNRVWKVQNTGVTDAVTISFPVTSVGTTTLAENDACAAYVLVYADDADFTTNVGITPLTTVDTAYEVSFNFPDGVSYFTFAKATPVTMGTVYLPAEMEISNETIPNCGVGSAWTYFRKSEDATLKLLAVSDVTTTSLAVVITPEGTEYDDGTRLTRMMPRITNVTDASSGSYTGVKVRVYYSPDELSATQVPGALTNSWFKYDGAPEDVMADVYNDGRFDAGKAIALIPDESGIEDGVHYVEFHNLTSFSSFVYVSSTLNLNEVLPVSLAEFEATVQGHQVLLNWTTASESNNRGFYVERSADAVNWTEVGFVASKAANGNSVYALNYSFTDKSPLSARNYYRLKQVDIDDKFQYSAVRMVNLGNAGTITVLPNPVQNILTVRGLEGPSTITVFDVNGKMMKIVQTRQDAVVQIDVSAWPAGIYIVKTADGYGNRELFKVMKQ